MLGVIGAVAATACGSPVLSYGVAEDAAEVEGVPYFLPEARLELSLSCLRDDKGQPKELAISIAPRLVPDRATGFRLLPDRSAWASQKQTFRTDQGLLTYVSTEDDATAVTVATQLLSAASNLIAFGASGGLTQASAFDAGAGPPSEPPPPTNDEILEAFGSVAPGTHSWVFRPEVGLDVSPAGTAARLQVLATTSTASGGHAQDTAIDSAMMAARAVPFAGVYARILEPRAVEVELQLSKAGLCARRAERLQAMEAAEQKLSSEITADETKLATLPPGKEKDDLAESIRKRKEQKAKAIAERTALAGRIGDEAVNLVWAGKTPGSTPVTGSFPVGHRTSTVLVPDETRLVKVPLQRAAVGKTKTDVTLVSGVVAEFHSEYPSTALEIVKIPVQVADSLLELPTKILQLKIDTTTKQKELLQAQKDIADLKAASQSQPPAPTPEAQEKARLAMELELLKLRTEIARLERELADLTAGDETP